MEIGGPSNYSSLQQPLQGSTTAPAAGGSSSSSASPPTHTLNHNNNSNNSSSGGGGGTASRANGNTVRSWTDRFERNERSERGDRWKQGERDRDRDRERWNPGSGEGGNVEGGGGGRGAEGGEGEGGGGGGGSSTSGPPTRMSAADRARALLAQPGGLYSAASAANSNAGGTGTSSAASAGAAGAASSFAPHMSSAERARAILQQGTGGRRASAPLKYSNLSAARAALQSSMRVDGKCFALCIADRLDLKKIAEKLAPAASPIAVTSHGPGNMEAVREDMVAVTEQMEQGLLSPQRPARTVSKEAPRAPPRVTLRTAAASVANAVTDVVASAVKGTGTGGQDAGASKADSQPLAGAELVRVFGSGESSVLQLKVFRNKDAFAFSFGAIVFWGFGMKEKESINELCLELQKHFAHRPLPLNEIDEESMDFIIKRKHESNSDGSEEEEEDRRSDRDADAAAKGAAAIRQDQIVLSTNNTYERLAHAYALAQSVRLGVFEFIVDRSIAKTRSIPETMANDGEVVLDERELSKQIGGLLMLRCDVNLHTDILDTPDIFWDEDSFEPHYVACREYLDIDKRVDILNQRLGVLKDLYDLLQNTLNVKHGNKLEWIVIILILVEVLLELLELVHDAWKP